jgi:putative tryptophan/tyrosine transport system substrate-binding protein
VPDRPMCWHFADMDTVLGDVRFRDRSGPGLATRRCRLVKRSRSALSLALGAAMRRREFIIVLGGATVSWSLHAFAQQSGPMRRIGVLIGGSENDPEEDRSLRALFRGLQDLGWKPGVNLQVDVRYGGGQIERIVAVAKELVAAQPDVLEIETTPGTAAVLAETHTIPVVFTTVSNPVGAGFVQSLSHPGSNATGFIYFEPSVAGKWPQLLKDVMPQVTRATVLFNPTAAPQADDFRQAIEAAATPMAIKTRMAFVSDIAATEREILATAQDLGTGLIIGPDAFTFANRYEIAQLANSAKVPAIYPLTSYATAGGLLSYGTDLPDLHRRAAIYIDRILKGAKIADLPVQLPSKFELAVNLKTARALGITIPDKLIAVADEVIE